MDIQEVAAEKLRATATRARYRDCYDLYLIWQQFRLETDHVVVLLKQKEIRQPILIEQVHSNWQQAQQEVTSELDAIYFSREVSNEDITNLLNQQHFAPIMPEDQSL